MVDAMGIDHDAILRGLTKYLGQTRGGHGTGEMTSAST